MAQFPNFQPPAAQNASPPSASGWLDPAAGASAQPAPSPSISIAQPQPYAVQTAAAALPVRELKGVGGWLMFLVLCLTIFGPTAALFFVIFLLVEAGAVSSAHPEVVTFAILLSVLVIGYSVWGLMVGTALWKMRPGVVIRARQYLLWGGIPFSIISSFLPVIALPPADQVDQAVPTAFIKSAIGVALVLVWNAYFSKSRRVAATFPRG
jgi:hypothetical protein